MDCPCGKELKFEECCGPIIAGERLAKTAEELMRSRYASYVKRDVGWIAESHDPETREEVDEDATREWAESTEWLKLEILDTKDGGENDDKGEVEFIARFRDKSKHEHNHHERSRFVKRDGHWYYQDGDVQKQAPVVRAAPKVGRNDPCPCGSGKKYKKCCGIKAA